MVFPFLCYVFRRRIGSGGFRLLQGGRKYFKLLQGVSEAMAESRRHILVVDDDEGMRELLVRYLSDNGYEVSGVADGLSMKRHLAAHQVDLHAARCHAAGRGRS
jgi:PleD family two-component response regulator